MKSFIKKNFSTYSGLPKSIYVLFFARIINRMGGFIFIVLTFILRDHFNMNATSISIYLLLIGISSMAGTFIGGLLTDHFGRKKIMLTAQALSAISLIPCGMYKDSLFIIYFLIATNFFMGVVRPASSAITIDVTSGEEQRKKAFSLLYLAINIGVAIGPLIAGFLYKNYFAWIFYGDALTTLIAVLLVAIFVPESKPSKEEMEKSKHNISSGEKADQGSALVLFFKKPILVSFCFFTFLGTMVYSQHRFSLPLQLSEVYGEARGPELFGYIMSFNAIIVLLATMTVTYLTKKLSAISNVQIAYIFYAIGFGMLYFSSNIILFLISTLLWTIGEILAITNAGIFTANHTPMSHRGRFNAVIQIIGGLGFSLGPVVFGPIIDFYGVNVLWIFVLGVALIASFGLHIIKKFDIRKKTN